MSQATAFEARENALQLIEEQWRFKFLWRGQLFLGYNKGSTKYGDFYRSKPDFFPVLSPSGRPVTTTFAHKYNHHRSLWIGHAKINGYNVFHDNNPERPNLGDIVLEEAEVESVEAGAAAAVRTRNVWTGKDGRRLATERRDFVVRPGIHDGRAHAIDLLSELRATEGPIELGQDTHAWLGVRVADTMDEEDGGLLLNSRGQRTEAECMRQPADWCDYSGLVAGQPVGVTIMRHPQNPPSGFFTRAYGTVLDNPTLFGPVRIEAGRSLLQRWRILIHEGDAQTFDIAAAYAAYQHGPG